MLRALPDSKPLRRTLLIAIPCLNEAKTIAAVVAGLPRNLPGISAIDILVVDDGSSDRSAELASAAGAVILRHSRNRGLGIAFQSAVSYAVQHGYDLMLNVDGDGQFSPNVIVRLIEPIIRGDADMVTGSRFAVLQRSVHQDRRPWESRPLRHPQARCARADRYRNHCE